MGATGAESTELALATARPRRGIDCESGSAEQSTLAKAAWEGRLLEVRELLKERADPNVFEAHSGGSTRLTPLMAAAAGDRVDVVAELLVAGADPDLPSPAGVVAADLAESTKKGKKISKLLAAFRVEIEDQLGCGGASPQPDGSASLLAARSEAVARVSKRGLALVEKALLGKKIWSSSCPDAGDDDDEDVMLAGDAALEGDEARKARKLRHQEKEKKDLEEETARLQRVAERAAARRGVDVEEERARRVAEKAAARRAKDPEEAEQQRLERVAEKAAARRSKHAAEEEAKQKKEEARLQRLAEKSTDRACARQMRAEQQEKIKDDHEEALNKKPVIKRKVVESGVHHCNLCGTSSQRLECGICGQFGMCQVCSKCGICGRASGFAAKVQKAHIPGMVGFV